MPQTNLRKVFHNLEKRIQVCLDVKGDQFQHRFRAGPVLHRSRYVYINFQVVISIIQFFIDNSLGPLATESPCILPLVFELLRHEMYISFSSKTCLQSCRTMPNKRNKAHHLTLYFNLLSMNWCSVECGYRNL